jgi:hypothetical protein
MQNDTTKNPTPAPGTIWQWTGDTHYEPRLCDPVTIDRIDEGDGLAYFADSTCANLHALRSHPSWSCIGIDTPAGRVMVGERRRHGEDIYTVTRIVDGQGVAVMRDGDATDYDNAAGWVASWPPLVSAPADPYRQPYKPERHIPPPKPANVPERARPSISFVMAPGATVDEVREVMERAMKDALAEEVRTEPKRKPYATADDLANALDPAAFGITNGRWDWDRASVRDFKMPIPFAMAPGMTEDEARETVRRIMGNALAARMSAPEVTAAAQKACGCAECKARATIADVNRLREAGYEARPDAAERLGLKLSDPRAAREQRRREIDAVLREDARRFPAFATARRAAVMAAEEGHRPHLNQLPAYLDGLRAYENAIAKGMRPARAKQEIPGVSEWVEWGWCAVGFTAYERARAMP